MLESVGNVDNKLHMQNEINDEMQQLDKEYVKDFINQRSNIAPSVMLFKYNKKRVKILTKATEVPVSLKGILYWMSRDVRVQDNWAMLFAQKLAFKNHVSLHVCFCLEPSPTYFLYRCNKFLVKGLEEVQKECEALNIKFHLFPTLPAKSISDFVELNNIGAIVCDFNPLAHYLELVEELKLKLPDNVPLCQVDAHNIVPCWFASDKFEYSAKNLRPKIMDKLNYFLTEFPPVIRHPYNSRITCESINWEYIISKFEDDKDGIGNNTRMILNAGYKAGIAMLQEFCESKIDKYGNHRNDPMSDAVSKLSPWIRNGHISAQRCVLAVQALGDNPNVACFIEEAVVRRELSENFCFYNDKYNKIEGAANWATTTLNEHRNDQRDYLYSCEQFEKSLTHDDLWNSAQIQLMQEGTIHGYLRMYWAKKILEWTSSPEEALDIALYLNDHYALDGLDPSGYTGCMWSIAGVHDQPWVERPVFGKIRYMNYAGCKKKFQVDSYVLKYGGVVHESDNRKDNDVEINASEKETAKRRSLKARNKKSL